MRTKTVLQAVAAATLFVAGTSAGAQAVTLVNGSFEDTTNFVPNGQDTDSLPGGSTDMTGWTVGAGHRVSWDGPTNPYGPGGTPFTASDGSYFLDLTDYQDGAPYGGVSQTLTTVAGQHYLVTFDLGSSNLYGLPSGIQVSAGATTHNYLSTLLGPINWESESFAFVATEASTTLAFLGSAGNAAIGLDNVAITEVAATPIPASAVMLGTGLLGLGVLGYRRGRTSSALSAA